jgi:hypothetical protein
MIAFSYLIFDIMASTVALGTAWTSANLLGTGLIGVTPKPASTGNVCTYLYAILNA